MEHQALMSFLAPEVPRPQFMKSVLAHIEARKRRLTRHRFFDERRRARSLHELLAFAPRLACWVGAFPGVLLVNAERTSAPELAALLRGHAREESGHDGWYFDDVELLTGLRPSASLEATNAYAPTRAATLRLQMEARATASDAQRLAFLLSLEATSEAFFSTLMPLVEARGGSARLRYFGAHHLTSERGHTIFEREVMERLEAMALTASDLVAIISLVDRIFAAFEVLFDGLCQPAESGRHAAQGG